MRIKRKNGLKVAAITIALLLCLALAIGITGAFYQAKRQATGTLSMDQGIIIDYNGFDKTAAEDWATWTRGVTLPLFKTNDAQPGQNIPVNPAGIRANEKSVNFYARVKLSYKFYNGETPVKLADATKLIKTSSSFFGTNWVESGDGYFYYATGSTLNKFEKGTQTFVDLFATDAKFIIEGAGFTGANNNGEGGGFVDGTTSINKIEVYLTLETLQGDATAEQAKALGWKISSEVNFAKVDEGKIVKSNTTEVVTDEQLNVTINGNQTKLEEVKFPYGEETVLEFDSKNVEYVELKYSDNTTEKFYELEASENSATKNSQIQVKANENRKVTAYVVGLWDSEYKGLTYATTGLNIYGSTYEITNGLTTTKYWGSDTTITVPSSVKVRERDLKVVLTGIDANYFGKGNLGIDFIRISYPCKFSWRYNGTTELISEFQNLSEAADFINNDNDWIKQHEFDENFKQYEFIFEYSALCETTNIFYKDKNVVEVGSATFGNTKCDTIIIGNNVEKINAMSCVYSTVKTVTLSSSVKTICGAAFNGCSNLTTTVGDIGGNWVEASDNSAVDANTLLKDISYDIKRA